MYEIIRVCLYCVNQRLIHVLCLRVVWIQFNSSNDVSKSAPDYFAWARPVAAPNTEGYYCCDKNRNVTAENAVKALAKKDPSCFA